MVHSCNLHRANAPVSDKVNCYEEGELHQRGRDRRLTREGNDGAEDAAEDRHLFGAGRDDAALHHSLPCIVLDNTDERDDLLHKRRAAVRGADFFIVKSRVPLARVLIQRDEDEEDGQRAHKGPTDDDGEVDECGGDLNESDAVED